MTNHTRIWVLPGDDCGIWKAENNGSAEMVVAVASFETSFAYEVA
jgi:hypothetical protein